MKAGWDVCWLSVASIGRLGNMPRAISRSWVHTFLTVFTSDRYLLCGRQESEIESHDSLAGDEVQLTLSQDRSHGVRVWNT